MKPIVKSLLPGREAYLTVLMILTAGALFSEGRAESAVPAPSSSGGVAPEIMVILYIVIGLQLLLVWFMYSNLKSMLKDFTGQKEQYVGQEHVVPGTETEYKPSFWEEVYTRLNGLKPMEEEKDIMLDHDYDGIRELGNSMPPWFKALFWGTILFAVFYLINYHIVPFANAGLNPEQEYQKELADAEAAMAEYRKKAANLVDETNVSLITEAADLQKGKNKFVELCAACHGQNGEGGVGPNLTDSYWLHGGDIKDVFKTIKYGIPDKGMISWQNDLKPVEMQAVASYIMTLQGTNPANAKEPQGELYQPKESAKDSLNTRKPDDSTMSKK